MSDNWVVQNLQNALDTWNKKMAEVWSLLTMSPQSFKGGGIWSVIVQINIAVKAIGLALLVLFFLVGVMKTSANLSDIKRPEHALKLFIRFAIAKGVVTYGLDLMLAVFSIGQGIMSTMMRASGVGSASKTTLPSSMVKVIEDVVCVADSALGGVYYRESVYHGAFIHYHTNCVRQVLQTV